MDSFVPAFVAALLAGAGDRPARIAALLAHRGATSLIVALLLGQTLAIALSVGGAIVVAPLLAPNARAFLLALALLLAGVTLLWRLAPIRLDGGAGAAAAAGFVGGDSTAFLAFALGARGPAPILAGTGALAAAVLLGVAAAGAATGWERLPLRLIRRVSGVMLATCGLIVGLGALRLI